MIDLVGKTYTIIGVDSNKADKVLKKYLKKQKKKSLWYKIKKILCGI